MDDGRIWTCPKGAIGEIVAEHALALGLVGLRGLRERIRTTEWGQMSGRSLIDGSVTIIGGGGIARSLTSLLAPWRVAVTIVRRTDTPFEGSARTLPADRLDEALPGADLVVIAAPLTPATTGLIGVRQLRLMESDAWLVNVARGALVVTDELVTALREGWIGGAALDVTDPEPLPPEHPLWSLERCVITPHTASTTEMSLPGLRALIVENISRFAAGRPLLGVIDPVAGY
jgi:phosphoglycerate dehydrogenase-like enzyme